MRDEILQLFYSRNIINVIIVFVLLFPSESKYYFGFNKTFFYCFCIQPLIVFLNIIYTIKE